MLLFAKNFVNFIHTDFFLCNFTFMDFPSPVGKFEALVLITTNVIPDCAVIMSTLYNVFTM